MNYIPNVLAVKANKTSTNQLKMVVFYEQSHLNKNNITKKRKAQEL